MSFSSSLMWSTSIGLAVLMAWYGYYVTRKSPPERDDAVVLGVGLFLVGLFLGTIVVNWVVFRSMRGAV